ncbi:uncharacterized protein N7498_002974 [Penicillium cinerascens]|uniref:Uncharacterized protein n=1 Tax=Penicillium cinerascens TaxID=70096 RepID=A0A9W9NB35_9EURO|nr:uncharacterized protein N7498_002974 [Penicillium cinerascens]KAJ5216567.1 hypothetical protein N7498_002974 [Penicillium cinerascens]
MSITVTTTNTTSLSVLADYEVHHSGAEDALALNQSSQPQQNSLPTWPTHHRRIPAYRPTNRELDYTQRPAGNGNPAEYAFIQIMLHGVWLNASAARLWRFTGGRINDKIFHYQVGGEW